MINLYAIFKPVMLVAKKAFFKNILVLGKENIPYGKPVLIASNHPSAFMDPIFVGLTMKQQIHFLARGDVFKTPFAKWALGQMNILPIFRKEDSENNHEKNEATYHICADIFKENKFIVIYPEGYCVQEKKLRPLKKGASRLAFFTLEKFNWDLDLYILPTGVNYSNPNRFQSDLVINYGKAIRVQDYKEEYLKDKNKANTDLTRFLEDEMKKLLVIIDKKELEVLADGVELICKENIEKDYKINFNNQLAVFETRKAIGKSLNQALADEEERLISLASEVYNYFESLKKIKLRDWLFANNNKSKSVLLDLFLFVLLSPIFGPVFLYNYYFFHLPNNLATKKIKNIEFYPSVLIGSGAILFMLFYIVSGILLSLFLPTVLFAPLVVVLMIVMGFGAIPYYRLFIKLKAKMRFNSLLKNRNPLLLKLIEERAQLKSSIELLIKKYPLKINFKG